MSEGGGQLTGIKNVTNSCYVNAVSQLLIMIDDMPRLISMDNKYKEYGNFLNDLLRRNNFVAINEHEYITQCIIPTGFDKSQKDPVQDLLIDLLNQVQNKNLFIKSPEDRTGLYMLNFIDPKSSVQKNLNEYIFINGNFSQTSNFILINLVAQSQYNLSQNLELNENITIVEENKIKIDKKYNLIAVVYHLGSVSAGHYIIAKKVNNDWYVINDDVVKKISGLNDAELRNTRPYILLYENDNNSGKVQPERPKNQKNQKNQEPQEPQEPKKRKPLTEEQITRLYDSGAYNYMQNHTDWLENKVFIDEQVDAVITKSNLLMNARQACNTNGSDYQQILKLIKGFKNIEEIKKLQEKIRLGFVADKKRTTKIQEQYILQLYDSGAYNYMRNHTDWLEKKQFTEEQIKSVIYKSYLLMNARQSGNTKANDYQQILKLIKGFKNLEEIKLLSTKIRTEFIDKKVKKESGNSLLTTFGNFFSPSQPQPLIAPQNSIIETVSNYVADNFITNFKMSSKPMTGTEFQVHDVATLYVQVRLNAFDKEFKRVFNVDNPVLNIYEILFNGEYNLSNIIHDYNSTIELLNKQNKGGMYAYASGSPHLPYYDLFIDKLRAHVKKYITNITINNARITIDDKNKYIIEFDGGDKELMAIRKDGNFIDEYNYNYYLKNVDYHGTKYNVFVDKNTGQWFAAIPYYPHKKMWIPSNSPEHNSNIKESDVMSLLNLLNGKKIDKFNINFASEIQSTVHTTNMKPNLIIPQPYLAAQTETIEKTEKTKLTTQQKDGYQFRNYISTNVQFDLPPGFANSFNKMHGGHITIITMYFNTDSRLANIINYNYYETYNKNKKYNKSNFGENRPVSKLNPFYDLEFDNQLLKIVNQYTKEIKLTTPKYEKLGEKFAVTYSDGKQNMNVLHNLIYNEITKIFQTGSVIQKTINIDGKQYYAIVNNISDNWPDDWIFATPKYEDNIWHITVPNGTEYDRDLIMRLSDLKNIEFKNLKISYLSFLNGNRLTVTGGSDSQNFDLYVDESGRIFYNNVETPFSSLPQNIQNKLK